jgi:nucleotide-binding universal stress UspA family protein
MLRLMPSNSSEKELEVAERKMMSWAAKENLLPYVHCQATATDARVETIIQESRQYDLLVMAAGTNVGFKKLFFGSLAEGVAKTSTRSMLIVYGRTS